MKLKLLNFFTQAIGGLKEVSHGTLQGLMLKDCLSTPQCTLTHTLTHTHSHTSSCHTYPPDVCARCYIYVILSHANTHHHLNLVSSLSLSHTHSAHLPAPCSLLSHVSWYSLGLHIAASPPVSRGQNRMLGLGVEAERTPACLSGSV